MSSAPCADCGRDADAGRGPLRPESKGVLTINCGTCGYALLMLGASREGIDMPGSNADGMQPWLAFHLGWLGAAHSFSPYVRRGK